MNLRDQVLFVSSHILTLPYDDRLDANKLIVYWRQNLRLSQLQQLKLERYVTAIKTRKGLKHDRV